jgi:hypothetical protein
MVAEGWYRDPYGRHEARWYSVGTPTDLVRDGANESQDAPPEDVEPGPLIEWAGIEAVDGADLQRADAAEKTSDDPSHDAEVEPPREDPTLYGPL